MVAKHRFKMSILIGLSLACMLACRHQQGVVTKGRKTAKTCDTLEVYKKLNGFWALQNPGKEYMLRELSLSTFERDDVHYFDENGQGVSGKFTFAVEDDSIKLVCRMDDKAKSTFNLVLKNDTLYLHSSQSDKIKRYIKKCVHLNHPEAFDLRPIKKGQQKRLYSKNLHGTWVPYGSRVPEKRVINATTRTYKIYNNDKIVESGTYSIRIYECYAIPHLTYVWKRTSTKGKTTIEYLNINGRWCDVLSDPFSLPNKVYLKQYSKTK